MSTRCSGRPPPTRRSRGPPRRLQGWLAHTLRKVCEQQILVDHYHHLMMSSMEGYIPPCGIFRRILDAEICHYHHLVMVAGGLQADEPCQANFGGAPFYDVISEEDGSTFASQVPGSTHHSPSG